MISRKSCFFVVFLTFMMISCSKTESSSMQTEVTLVPQEKEYIRKEKLIPIPASCPKKHYIYMSWNLENFGKSKTPETLDMMAEISREADFIAGQEVSVSSFGSQAVARYADALGRKGKKWDYIISDHTQSVDNSGVEKYAYLWSSGEVNQREAHLVGDLVEAIDREPYSITFHIGNTSLTAVEIHTVPTAKNPIDEVVALAKSGELNQSGNMIVSGDFNLGAKDTDPLMEKAGFTGHIYEKTSIKQKVGRRGEHLLYQYDNIYTKGKIEVCGSGVIDFPEKLFSPVNDENLKAARKLSDHLPVYIIFSLRD